LRELRHIHTVAKSPRPRRTRFGRAPAGKVLRTVRTLIRSVSGLDACQVLPRFARETAQIEFQLVSVEARTVHTEAGFSIAGTSFARALEPPLAAAGPPVGDAPATAAASYSAASVTSDFASMAEVETTPAVAGGTAVIEAPETVTAQVAGQVARPASISKEAPARELDRNGRPVNKRRHVRIRVSFSACVRHPAHPDEIVECENVSKGGVCFHGLEQYPLDSFIRLAAPFSPGETALFVSARITRIEVLSDGEVFRYGVEYVNSSIPAHSSGRPAV